MTWHCIALLALLTGQTWPRCFQSLECCEYCCHPATIRACTTPSVSTSANQNPKYFGKVWQQNKWNFANFLQPPLITCQEMRRPEWKESNVVSSWEPNKPKKRCFSFEPFLFLAKSSCYCSAHTILSSAHSCQGHCFTSLLSILSISCPLDWSDV